MDEKDLASLRKQLSHLKDNRRNYEEEWRRTQDPRLKTEISYIKEQIDSLNAQINHQEDPLAQVKRLLFPNLDILWPPDPSEADMPSPIEFMKGWGGRRAVLADLDAPRDATDLVVERAMELTDGKQRVSFVLITGLPGAGKSTLLFRAGRRLAEDSQGFVLYLVEGGQLDAGAVSAIRQTYELIGQPIYVLIDDAASHYDGIARCASVLDGKVPVVMIAAETQSRWNKQRKGARGWVARGKEDTPIDTSLLSDKDVKELIQRIREFGQIGVLETLEEEQVAEVLAQASENNLLVMMSELSSESQGHFDELVRLEYEGLEPKAQAAYLDTCLVACYGLTMPVTLLQRLHRMDGFSATRLEVLGPAQGVLVPSRDWSQVQPRHDRIAESVIQSEYGVDLYAKYRHLAGLVGAIDNTSGEQESLVWNVLKHPRTRADFASLPEAVRPVYERTINVVTPESRPGMMRLLAEAEIGADNLERGRRILTEIIQEYRYYTLAYHRYARLEMAQARYGQACELIEQAFEWSDDHAMEQFGSMLFHAYGDALHKLGEHEEARERYQEGIECDHKNSYIYHSWGRMEMRLGNYDVARELFRNGMRVDSGNSYLYAALGELEYTYGTLEEAERILRDGLLLSSCNPYLYDIFAQVLVEQRRADDARRILRTGLQTDKANIYLLRRWADLEFRQQDYDQAQLLYERLLATLGSRARAVPVDAEELKPGESLDQFGQQLAVKEACDRLATIHVQLGEIDEARHLYEQALRSHRNNIPLLQSFASFLTNEGKFDEARGVLDAAISLDGENSYLFHSYGCLERSAGNYDRAAGHFDQGIKFDPENLLLYLDLSKMVWQLGDYHQAKAVLDHSLPFVEEPNELWNQIAHHYHQIGESASTDKDFELAREALAQSYQMLPENLANIHAYATLEMRVGNLKHARLLLERAKALEPQNPYVLHGLGQLAEKEGDYPQAMAWYEEGHDVEAENPHFCYSYARLAMELGHLDDAEQMLKEGLQGEETDNPFLLSCMGDLRWRQGRRHDALAHYSQAQQSGYALTSERISGWLSEAETLESNVAREVFEWAIEVSPDDSNLYHRYARWETKYGNREHAKQLLQEGLEKGEKNSYLYHTLGQLAEEEQDLEAAEQYYRAGLEADDRNVYLYHGLGSVLITGGRCQSAIEIIKEGLSIDEDNSYLYQQYRECGISEVRDGNREVGTAVLKECLALRKTDERAYTWLRRAGFQYAREKQYGATRDILDYCRPIRTDVQLLIHYALIELETGRLNRAEELLEEGFGADQHNSWLFHALARVKIAQGNLDAAEEALTRGVSKDLNNSYLYHTWAQMEESQQRWQRARELYEEGLAADDTNPALYYSYARLEQRRGNPSKALRLLAEGLRQDQANPRIRRALISGKFLETYTEKLDEARDLFQLLLTHTADKNSKVMLYHRYAKAELRHGNRDRARALLAEALTMDEENSYCRHTLGVMAMEEGDLETARTHFEIGLAHDKSNAYLYDGLTEVHLRLGDYRAARQVAAEGLAVDEGNDYLYRHYRQCGVFEIRKGDREVGRETLSRCLALRNDDLRVYYELARIESEEDEWLRAIQILQDGLKSVPAKTIKEANNADVRRVIRLFATRARQAEDAGQLDDTLLLYRQLVEWQPDNVRWYDQCARVALRLGKPEEAQRWAEDGLLQNEEYAFLHYHAATAFASQLCVTDARRHFERAIELDDEQWSFYHSYGRMEADIGNYPRGRELFERGLSIAPDNVYILHSYGEREARWDPDRARDRLRKGLVQPNADVGRFVRALVQIEIDEGKSEAAFETIQPHFNQERANPIHYRTYRQVALTLAREGKTMLARDALNQLLRVSPTDVELWHEYAKIEARDGRHGEVQKLFRFCLEQTVDQASLYETYAKVLKRLRRYQEARDILESLRNLVPNRVSLYIEYGLVEIEAEQYDKAEQILREGLAIRKEDAGLYRALAKLESERRNLEKAESWLTKGIGYNPLDARLHYDLAKLEETRGNVSAAFEQYQAAIECDRPFRNLYRDYAQLAIKKGNLDLAATILNGGFRHYPTDSHLLTEYANIEKKRGHYGKAREWLNRAISYDRRNPWRYHNLARLEVAAGELEEAMAVYDRAFVIFQTGCLLYLGAGQVQEEWASQLALAGGEVSEVEAHLHRAKDLVEQARRIDPGSYACEATLKRITVRIEEFGLAEKMHLREIDQRPNVAYSYVKYALWLRKELRFAEAEAYFRKALGLERDPRTLQTLAMLLQNQGRNDEANDLHLEAVRADKAQHYVSYADFLASHMREIEAAEHYYHMAYKQERHTSRWLMHLAILHYRHRGAFEEAETWFRRALAEEQRQGTPNKRVVIQNYLEFLVDQKRCNEAFELVSSLSSSMRQKPEVIVAINYCWTHCESNRGEADIRSSFEHAITIAETQRLRPQSGIYDDKQAAWVHYRYALYLWKHCGDCEVAKEHFERMCEAQPYPVPDFMGTYALFLIEQGDLSTADSIVVSVTRIDAENDRVVQAQKLLGDMRDQDVG